MITSLYDVSIIIRPPTLRSYPPNASSVTPTTHSFVFLAHIYGLWWPSCAGAAGENAAKNWLDTGPILMEMLSAGGQSPIHDITEWHDSLPALCLLTIGGTQLLVQSQKSILLER